MPARKPAPQPDPAPAPGAAPYVFALVCVAMAVGSLFFKLDGKFIGLVLLALSPWLAPKLLPFLETLKFGGVELKFRKELEERVTKTEQIAQATAAVVMPPKPARTRKKAMSAAVGAAESVLDIFDNAVPAPPLDAGEPAADAAADNDDPNKGNFGEQRERDGYRVSAEVTPVPQSTGVFLIHAWVDTTADRGSPRDGTPVVFHLHPSFGSGPVTVPARGGVAMLDRLAWGAFTIGVEVEGVRLELDLASPKDVPDAPADFRAR
jgi:hypothetical protein